MTTLSNLQNSNRPLPQTPSDLGPAPSIARRVANAVRAVVVGMRGLVGFKPTADVLEGIAAQYEHAGRTDEARAMRAAAVLHRRAVAPHGSARPDAV